jgi:hypothetical protein
MTQAGKSRREAWFNGAVHPTIIAPLAGMVLQKIEALNEIAQREKGKEERDPPWRALQKRPGPGQETVASEAPLFEANQP